LRERVVWLFAAPGEIAQMKRSKTPSGLQRAFDAARFGERNILNLRESLPTPTAAALRAEAWLRQKQVEAVDEVLVITGRGNNSDNGISPVREAIVRLIISLRRRNVIDRYEEHTPGSFSIRLASINAMVDAPPRRREPKRPASGEALPELSAANQRMLRDLAERSLEGLGIKQTDAFLEAEMQRQLRAISAALGAADQREAKLRAALRAALDQTI
jgi:hypothetical protein